MRNYFVLLSLLFGLLVTTPTRAGDVVETAKDVAGAVFSEVERRVIRDYYCEQYGGDICRERQHRYGDYDDRHHSKHKKQKGLPPGLAKRDQLPPGLAKRKQLPPGLAKRALPHELEDRLPHRKGYERVVADGRVVLIEKASGVVVDILEDILVKD
jgi:hypothetical protein